MCLGLPACRHQLLPSAQNRWRPVPAQRPPSVYRGQAERLRSSVVSSGRRLRKAGAAHAQLSKADTGSPAQRAPVKTQGLPHNRADGRRRPSSEHRPPEAPRVTSTEEPGAKPGALSCRKNEAVPSPLSRTGRVSQSQPPAPTVGGSRLRDASWLLKPLQRLPPPPEAVLTLGCPWPWRAPCVPAVTGGSSPHRQQRLTMFLLSFRAPGPAPSGETHGTRRPRRWSTPHSRVPESRDCPLARP